MTPASRAALALPFLAATALGSAGCAEDFPPYNRLAELRVLAIKSEPVAPKPGETAKLSAFVYAPEGKTVSYAWSWCPFTSSAREGYECRVDESQLAMLAMAGAGMPPRLDLGSGETAELPHTVAPEVLDQICAGVPGTPQLVDCDEGFPVKILLTVKTDDDEVKAVRTLRLRRARDVEENTNPSISDLVAIADDGARRPLTAMPPVSVPRNKNTPVAVNVPLTAAEMYTDTDDRGTPVPGARERLLLTWFVESGTLEEARTAFLADVQDLQDPFQNKWKPAIGKDFPRDRSRVIVVVRDNRGGVSWTEGVAQLEAAR